MDYVTTAWADTALPPKQIFSLSWESNWCPVAVVCLDPPLPLHTIVDGEAWEWTWHTEMVTGFGGERLARQCYRASPPPRPAPRVVLSDFAHGMGTRS